MTEFRPHSVKQERALFAYFEQGIRLTILATGIQYGKTTVGAYWLKWLMLYYADDPTSNFIITSPSFRILEQSTLPPFLRLMDGLGKFSRQKMNFVMTNGPTCWFRTGTDADSIVGLTNVRAILGDEAGLYSRYFWDNIQGRAAFKEAPIMLVTSPYSQNWLYKDYVRHLERDPASIESTLLIQARSDENPYFPKAEYERRKKTMDPRRFEMMFGGEFGKMEGLVYDAWDDEENTCAPMSLPVGTDLVAGVDWGNRHAYVIHVRAITREGYHFQVAEYYATRLNPLDMVQAARTLKLAWGIRVFYCDPSQPGMIDLFNKHNLTAVGAENDIKIGVGLHYELIKSRRFKLFRGKCPNSLDQYSTYHYPSPKDLKPDQDEKDIKPVKEGDDAMDAARYCTVSCFHLSEGKRPMKGGLDPLTNLEKLPHDKQIEILKRRPSRSAASERWS